MAKKKIKERDIEQLEQELIVDPNAAAAKLPSDLSQGRQTLYDYMEIPCSQIVPFTQKESGKDFSRMNEDKFSSMVESVREHGVLEAISVRMIAFGKYEILSGEHRWRASVAAGRQTIPAKVYRDISDQKANIIFSVTNLMRREMTFSDKVNGWHRFLENTNRQGIRTDLDNTLQTEKDTLNISLRQIQRYARMYNLLDEFKQAADENKLTQSAAYQLSFLSAEQQGQITEYIGRIDEKKAKQLAQLAKENNWSAEQIKNIFESAKPANKTMSNIKAYAKKKLNKTAFEQLDTIFEKALDMYLEQNPEMRKTK